MVKIIITENQFKRLINENFVLYGATFEVNNDGTISVSTDDKTTKIRFSKYYMDINVVVISNIFIFFIPLIYLQITSNNSTQLVDIPPPSDTFHPFLIWEVLCQSVSSTLEFQPQTRI